MPVPPQVIFSEHAVSGVDPSGVRHLDLGPASGYAFVKNLGTDPGEYLDFGSINISQGKQETSTKAVIARLGQYNDMTEAIFNLRFWLPDIADFTIGTFKFNGFPSGSWLQNLSLTESSGTFISTVLPSGQNIWRNVPGKTFDRNDTDFQEITASGADDQVTMYQYLNITVSPDAAIKAYGGDGGGFTYRLSYDYK